MCGIFGYVGSKDAQAVLIGGLRTLEYRGYDSAGLYIAGAGVTKAVGKVIALEQKLGRSPLVGTAGIAHTRWATHGEPSERNAHPHIDMSETIHLVHNGIIENWQEIKDGLLAQGISFVSQTDTEVLTKLIGTLYAGNLRRAVGQALQIVRGTYGIAVMSERNPGEIIVAAMGSPIVLGVGDGEYFISSDPSALLTHTRTVVYLEDGEVATVTAGGYEVTTLQGKKRQKDANTLDWEVGVAQKNGFAHFMLKEIFEGPEVIENTIAGRILADVTGVKLGGLEGYLPQITALERLLVVGCGSAYYAGQVGRLMLEQYAGLPVEVELGSEYRYKRRFIHDKSALLAVTQSGETADTLASVRVAKEMGMLTLGIVNTVGSTIARETDAGVHNHAGPEIAVASTKAFLSQLTVFVLMTVLIGRANGSLSKKEVKEIVSELRTLPEVIRTILAQAAEIERVAQKYASYADMMYIGRKFHAPIAYEGSLKLKEVSYIHAEAYAGGELKHGSIALLGPAFPVFALVPDDDVREKMLSNIAEVRARKAPVIALACTGDTEATAVADDVIYMPKVHPILQPIVSTVPLQLFAYYIGVAKGLDVDQPRNLAKSVTVE